MKNRKADQINFIRKENLDKVRGHQQFEDTNKGPAHKDSNRNDINDPIG